MTDFQNKVYEAVKKIPKGQTYKQIGKEIGSKAYRAIGQALKRNPDPITIPCHRVIKSDGTLGGYFGKMTDEKRRLLKEEGAI